MDFKTVFILSLCACAVVALIINRYRKLPKSVFAFFAVAIIVSLCWLTFELRNHNARTETFADVPEDSPDVFIEAAKDINVPAGETRIALPEIGFDTHFGNFLRLCFEGNSPVTEQAFLDKVKFYLLLSDGEIVSTTGIFFERDEEKSFPERFILKILFLSSDKFVPAKARCLIIDNGFDFAFAVPEISVGTKPSRNMGESK